MSEKSIATLPGHEFLREVERVLTPTLTEPFSEETKKLRNMVLLLGFVLTLLAMGVLSVAAKPVQLPLGLTVTVTKGLTGVLIILSSFFTVVLAARSYSEWHLWRLKHQAPLLEVKGMSEQISSAQAEISRRRRSELQRLVGLLNSGARVTSSEAEAQFQVLADQEDQHGPEWQQLMAMQDTLLEMLVPTRRSFYLRLWLEAVFPLGFAGIAILWALFTQ